MATRPVFVSHTADNPCHEIATDFQWFPGFSLAQKQRSITSLHESFTAAHPGHTLLEISSKSPNPLGIALSAFNLTLTHNNHTMIVEAAFQGSKVFASAGPFTEIYELSAREAKRFPKLKESGALTHFNFFGTHFPLTPTTFFYDYLYITALHSHPDLAAQIQNFTAFTDIEFNPAKQLNCQARSAATYVALCTHKLIDAALSSPEAFKEVVYRR